MIMKGCLLVPAFVLGLVAACLANVVVVGGLAHEQTAKAGETYEGSIMLKNEDYADCDVRVYQTDYLFRASGETFYDEAGASWRSNADWISVSPQWLTVPARSNASVHYSVKIPDDPGLNGSYWSMVMVEPLESTSQTVKDENGDARVGLTTLVRYGIQVVTDIGDTASREIRFQDSRLVDSEGRRLLEIDVENTGEAWLSPFLSLELYDKDGSPLYHFDGRQQRIYPGCSVRHTIDLTGVPQGVYKAVAIVDNRDEHVFGAQYDLWIE
jgi:hypothetical protein